MNKKRLGMIFQAFFIVYQSQIGLKTDMV